MRLLGRQGFRAKAIVLAGMAFVALTAVPASASTNTVTVGTANLPQFPCTNNPCSGGSLNGTIEGKGGGYKFNGGTVHSDYIYTEKCNLGDVVPTTGTAEGTFTVTGSKDTIAAHFFWQRSGLTANVTLDSISIDGGPATGVAAGTGVFEPAGKGRCGKPAKIIAEVEIVISV